MIVKTAKAKNRIITWTLIIGLIACFIALIILSHSDATTDQNSIETTSITEEAEYTAAPLS